MVAVLVGNGLQEIPMPDMTGYAKNIGGLGLVSVVNLMLNANRRFVSYDNGSAVVWRSLQ